MDDKLSFANIHGYESYDSAGNVQYARGSCFVFEKVPILPFIFMRFFFFFFPLFSLNHYKICVVIIP